MGRGEPEIWVDMGLERLGTAAPHLRSGPRSAGVLRPPGLPPALDSGRLGAFRYGRP